MAIRRDDIARLSGSDEYAKYLLRARRRFEQGQAATLNQIRGVYRRAAEEIRKDINKLTPGTLRYEHLTALQTNLDRRAAEMSKEVVAAVHQGIWMASTAGSSGTADVAAHMLQGAFPAADVKRLFAGINERAVLAMLARTRQDGLKISDRVWRTSERARNSIRIIVEDAVARGQDARTTAKQVQKYLQPGVWTAHKAETRKRLGVHKDVSYEAMRLARTEMNNAFHEGMVAANQHSPGYRGIYWRLSLGRVMPRPDVCDDMAANTSHGEPGFYPKGYEPTRPHPACMCVTISAWESPEQFTERLREWMKNPALQPDIEKWYNEDARRFMGRPVAPLMPTTLIQTALRAKEDEIARLPHERIYILDRQGNVVFTKDGMVSQIGFTEADIRSIVAAGPEIVATHNHPTVGGSFSLDDIHFSILTNVSETRAVGRTYVHSMHRPEAGWPQRQVVDVEYSIANSAVESDFWQKIHAGQMTPEAAQAEHHHTVWTAVAERLGLNYAREVR